jgi:hypothetical protein
LVTTSLVNNTATCAPTAPSPQSDNADWTTRRASLTIPPTGLSPTVTRTAPPVRDGPKPAEPTPNALPSNEHQA